MLIAKVILNGIEYPAPLVEALKKQGLLKDERRAVPYSPVEIVGAPVWFQSSDGEEQIFGTVTALHFSNRRGVRLFVSSPELSGDKAIASFDYNENGWFVRSRTLYNSNHERLYGVLHIL